MVEKIIELCARNRLLVLLGVGFALIASLVSIKKMKLDAIPDLSDPQVIVFTEWMGRSPTLVEDQVTYPIVSKLIGTPHVTDVRGFSMFGMSFVYVIFDEGTDVYWARSRVLEYMNGLRGALPEGVEPDAGTGRDRHRLDVPVRADRQDRQAQPRRAAHLPGLHAALRAGQRARRRRGRERRRLPEAVPGHGRSEPPARLRRDAERGDRRHPPVEQRRRRPHHRVLGARVLRARARLHPRPRRDREDRAARERAERHAAAGEGRRHGALRARHPARPARVERRRRGGRRRRRHALRRERARRHRPREEEDRGPQAQLPRRRGADHRLRPLRPHRAVDRHAQARADRGGDRRQPRDHAVPAALAQLAAADPVAADQRRARRSSRWCCSTSRRRS